MSMRRSTRRRVADQHGQSVVEFAVSSLLFFLLLFGIIEVGLAIYRYNLVSDLAQEGARRAVVCGSASVLPGGNCDIDSYVRNRAAGLISIDSVTVNPTPGTLEAGDLVPMGAG